MPSPNFSRLFLPLLAFFAASFLPFALRAQELPLEHCDTLPMVKVVAAGRDSWFLVDTAATSLLNLKSFNDGASQEVSITSWSGTMATSARQVKLSKLAVGLTTFWQVTLPAIDLSAIGNACGRKIDGILGVDLLNRMGATIDLKKQILRIRTAEEERSAALADEMQRDMHRCLQAFNEADEKTFTDCLDPDIMLFSSEKQLNGREKVIGYFHDRYFHQPTAAHLDLHESAFHAIGEAVWYEYEFAIDSAAGKIHGRGMAMCKKSQGRWRMASMHHSLLERPSAIASTLRPIN